MGRKEGGSLFHQMLQSPNLMELSDRKRSDGSAIPASFRTQKNYRDNLHKAADYFKAQGIRRVGEIDAEKIQQ